MKKILTFFVAASLAACSSSEGGNGAEDQENTKTNSKIPIEKKDAEAEKKLSKNVEITIKTPGESMQEMRFEPSKLEVAAGAKVTLTLENIADSEAMIHNWILIKLGNQQKVLDLALKLSPEQDYVPDSPLILAATGLAKPGETQTVTFTAPEKPGTYQFICTYPGHQDMKGLMLVK